MIVQCQCQDCLRWFEDAYRSTICPHDTFAANDGENNFEHHPHSYLSHVEPIDKAFGEVPVRRHRIRNPSWRRRDWAREYWEAAALGITEAHSYSPDTAAEHADQMLAEWRKRWQDDGSEQLVSIARRLPMPEGVQ